MTALARILRKDIEPISRWCILIGGGTVVAIALLITASVISRAALGIALGFTVELVEILLIIIFFSGFAYTELRQRHIQVDVVVDKFSPPVKLAISTCACLLAMGIVAIISWEAVETGRFLWIEHIRTGMLRIPRWPFAILIAFFMGLFFMALLVSFLESLNKLIASGIKNSLWLVPGIIVTIFLFVTSLRPGVLAVGIAPNTFGIIAILLLFVLILLLRVHIGAAMAVIALWGTSYVTSLDAGLANLGITSYFVASSYEWSIAPLFILMGMIVAAAALNRDLFRTAYTWVGQLPGGLAQAAIAACGVFAAIVGDSLSGAITMGTVALPEMKRYKYDSKMATGAIAAGGTIGILIPPSIGFIVYGILTEQSIGRLFMAGILPGVLAVVLFMLLVYVRCRVNPALGPPGPSTRFRDKIVSIRYSWAVILLILLVIGGIYFGVFTPNEAGGVGCIGAIVISMAMRRITLKAFEDAVLGAMQMVSLIFFIFIYAFALTQFVAVTKLSFALAGFISGLEVHSYVTLTLILVIYLILGCLMNSVPVLILTLPLIYPTVLALGFDPIWFGVLMVIMVEIGQITPPIGITVFGMAGIARDVPMYDIFKGVAPFWLLLLVVVGIVVAFPQIALFLPNLMKGG